MNYFTMTELVSDLLRYRKPAEKMGRRKKRKVPRRRRRPVRRYDRRR